jgi:thioredoxin reductase (NADPH)
MLSSLVVENVKTGEVKELTKPEDAPMIGLFVFAGNVPQTGLFGGLLEMEAGYILTDEDMRTNIPGVYAAGDVRAKKLRQIVTATADGAIAATEISKLL